MLPNHFASKCVFFDSINFPKGFTRSGYFSLDESKILVATGHIIKQLSNGKLTPENYHQERMLSVIRKEIQAETLVEKTWVKYLDICQSQELSRRYPTNVFTELEA